MVDMVAVVVMFGLLVEGRGVVEMVIQIWTGESLRRENEGASAILPLCSYMRVNGTRTSSKRTESNPSVGSGSRCGLPLRSTIGSYSIVAYKTSFPSLAGSVH